LVLSPNFQEANGRFALPPADAHVSDVVETETRFKLREQDFIK